MTSPAHPIPKKTHPRKTLCLLVFLALIVVGLLVVTSLRQGTVERAELILAPTTCDALINLAVSVQKRSAGCSYRGPVEHRFSSVLLQDVKIPSDAILAERHLPSGAEK